MKENKILYAVIAVLVVGLVLSLVKLRSMQSEISDLQNSVFSLERRLSSDINGIYANVDAMLKKEASIFSDISYECGTLQDDARTVPVTFTAIPKTFTEDTALTVEINGESWAFEKNGSVYTAEISVDIFTPYGQPVFTLECEDGLKTEVGNMDFSYLWEEYLPHVAASFNGTYAYGGRSIRINGTIDANLAYYARYPSAGISCVSVISCKTVVELNGEIIDERDMQLNSGGGGFTLALDTYYQTEKGDRLDIYILAEDTAGYIHKEAVDSIIAGGGAGEDEGLAPDDYGDVIYDKNGNLVSGNNESEWK